MEKRRGEVVRARSGGTATESEGSTTLETPMKSRVVKLGATLGLTVEVEPDADPAALEEIVLAEGRRAARELYGQLLQALDEDAVSTQGGVRQRREERWIATLMGRVRISRYRVRSGGRTMHPLDSRLGLGRGEASPALTRLVVRIASILPYRQAAAFLSMFTGETVSPQTCMRILRQHRARTGKGDPSRTSQKTQSEAPTSPA